MKIAEHSGVFIDQTAIPEVAHNPGWTVHEAGRTTLEAKSGESACVGAFLRPWMLGSALLVPSRVPPLPLSGSTWRAAQKRASEPVRCFWSSARNWWRWLRTTGTVFGRNATSLVMRPSPRGTSQRTVLLRRDLESFVVIHPCFRPSMLFVKQVLI